MERMLATNIRKLIDAPWKNESELVILVTPNDGLPLFVGFNDHGTAVAGVISASANNSLGIVGVAPAVEIIALKACWQLQEQTDTAHCNSLTLAQALAAAISEDAQVVNLSLLPVTPEDIAYLDHLLGTGRITVLSRGYGNCRITNCAVANTWRLVYYNSQDKVILNTVEVSGVPEVACAAPEDLHDSLDRLAEVLAWVDGG